MAQIGLVFEQVVSPEAEPPIDGAPAQEQVVRSARAKALAVGRFLAERGRAGAIVIGADTVVCCGARVLGKPADKGAAAAMLRALSGRTHQVYTGLAVIDPQGHLAADWVVTQVRMRPLSEADIRAYVASGEPMDKAGAYGIQGRAGRFIEHIEGCYYNVVGLPLARLSGLLEAAGYDFAGGDSPSSPIDGTPHE